MVEFIYGKLMYLKTEGFDRWHAIRTLPHINEEMWDNYILLFQTNDLPEQLLLKEAEANFVKVLKRVEKETRREYNKIFRSKPKRDSRLVTGKQIRRKKTRTTEGNS